MSISTLLFTCADSIDKLLLTLGIVTAIITGLGSPAFAYLFGNIIDAFSKDAVTMMRDMTQLIIVILIIGGIMWITSYIQYTCGTLFAERMGMKVKLAYLKAILS